LRLVLFVVSFNAKDIFAEKGNTTRIHAEQWLSFLQDYDMKVGTRLYLKWTGEGENIEIMGALGGVNDCHHRRADLQIIHGDMVMVC
jgi:hypothetical protein